MGGWCLPASVLAVVTRGTGVASASRPSAPGATAPAAAADPFRSCTGRTGCFGPAYGRCWSVGDLPLGRFVAHVFVPFS